MSRRLCVACETELKRGITPWHLRCTSCGYEASDLQPTINDLSSHKQVDESNREIGLKAIRVANFRAILSLLDGRKAMPGRKLLDVGAAHGWFLEQAASDYKVLGVEPDEYVAAQTSQRGLPVRVGYFPSVLQADETFDVIIFNDVIEHIPDINSALDACYRHLGDEGRLVLNLPCSNGLFYRLSLFLSRLGWSGPFERLWQKGFPSPHVHYFNKDNLKDTVTRHGFAMEKTGELPSVRGKGLAERIKLASDTSTIGFVIQYLGTLAVLPWTRIFPSDIMVSIFRKV